MAWPWARIPGLEALVSLAPARPEQRMRSMRSCLQRWLPSTCLSAALLSGCGSGLHAAGPMAPLRPASLSDTTPLIGNPEAILLFSQIGSDGSTTTLFEQGARYADSNGNGQADRGDAGFFNPASTVKVGIALAAVAKLKENRLSLAAEYSRRGRDDWRRISSDLQSMLAISDNEATNRLILWLGFDALNQRLRQLGLAGIEVNRLMLDRGTLIASPPISVREGGRRLEQPALASSRRPTCLESPGKTGNCATAASLAASMVLVARQGDQAGSLHSWLAAVLAKRPKDLGYPEEANYCRFIDGAPTDARHSMSRLLSKCGVALFSHTHSDLSVIELNDGRRLVLLIARRYPQAPADAAVVTSFQNTAAALLARLP